MMKSSTKGTEMTIATSVAERVAVTIDNNKLSNMKLEQKQGLEKKVIYKSKDIINGKPYYCIAELNTLTDDYFRGKNIVKLNIYVFWFINDSELINSISEAQNIDTYIKANRTKFTGTNGTGSKYLKYQKLIMLSND